MGGFSRYRNIITKNSEQRIANSEDQTAHECLCRLAGVVTIGLHNEHAVFSCLLVRGEIVKRKATRGKGRGMGK